MYALFVFAFHASMHALEQLWRPVAPTNLFSLFLNLTGENTAPQVTHVCGLTRLLAVMQASEQNVANF